MAERAVIINFHGVGDQPRALDDGEAQVWLDLERFDALLDAVAGRPGVRITFDDGNASDVEHALPGLSARGLRATFFPVAGRLGEPTFVDADGVRRLHAAGMEIGCHGMRHRRWRGLDDAALDEELVASKRMLEDVVGAPVTAAACPFGAYDRRVLAALRRAGYTRVYTSDRGTARAGQWLQARNTVRDGEDPHLVERILTAERGRAHAVRRGAKLAVKRWR